MGPFSQNAGSVTYLPYRACDQCRSRKILALGRVNRERNIADQSISHFNPFARSLLLISSSSSNRVSAIEDRLTRIEDSISALAKPQKPVEQTHTAAKNSRNSVHFPSAETPFQASGSSIEAQVSFSCRHLQDIIDNSIVWEEERDVLRSLLGCLQNLVASGPSPSKGTPLPSDLPHARPLNGGEVSLVTLPMPALEDVLSLLRDLRQTRPVTFPMVCAFGNVDKLAEHCRRLYVPVCDDDASFVSFLIVNAALFFLFKDKMALSVHTGDQEAVVRFLARRNICRDNVETALAHMPLAAVQPRPEALLALVLAAGYCIEVSRPWLASRLNTAACQMAIELGCHRGMDPKNSDDCQSQAVLFWLAYMHDRALSLRLGRAPVLQDYDITVPRTLAPLAAEFEGHRANLSSWIVLAEVQGRMYHRLYSPAAASRQDSSQKRVQVARDCASALIVEASNTRRRRIGLERRLRNWPVEGHVGQENDRGQYHYDTTSTACVGDDDRTSMEVEAMLLRIDEVTVLSSLTMAFQAIPPGHDEDDRQDRQHELGSIYGEGDEHEESKDVDLLPPRPINSKVFCSDCIATARKAILIHLEYLQLTEGNPMLVAMHMHWTVLLVPFVPFVVLFSYVVEQPDTEEDLFSLQRCVASLRPWQKLSTHAEQLFRICQGLCEAAQVYTTRRRHMSQ